MRSSEADRYTIASKFTNLARALIQIGHALTCRKPKLNIFTTLALENSSQCLVIEHKLY